MVERTLKVCHLLFCGFFHSSPRCCYIMKTMCRSNWVGRRQTSVDGSIKMREASGMNELVQNDCEKYVRVDNFGRK